MRAHSQHTDVGPHGLKRNTRSRVVRDDLRDVDEVCSSCQHSAPKQTNKARGCITVVTEAALVEAERPVRNLRRFTNNIGILTCHLGRVVLVSCKEVEIEDTANDIILERRASALSVVDFDIYTIRVREEDTMCARRAVLVVDRVVPVQVRTLRDAVCVARPERARVVVRRQAEAVGMLAEAVQIRVCG